MLNTVGPERLVFGTDYYSMMGGPQPRRRSRRAGGERRAREHKAAILGGNLRRILRLPTP